MAESQDQPGRGSCSLTEGSFCHHSKRRLWKATQMQSTRTQMYRLCSELYSSTRQGSWLNKSTRAGSLLKSEGRRSPQFRAMQEPGLWLIIHGVEEGLQHTVGLVQLGHTGRLLVTVQIPPGQSWQFSDDIRNWEYLNCKDGDFNI